MQKMLKLALGAVLAIGMVAPAMAQENFPDVPDNHWAYEALKNLKDKVLFGYPDGLYRGNRPMSRYEFAVAINQLHQLLAGRISGLEDQIKSLEGMIKGQDNSGLGALRDQMGALTKRVETLENGHAELKKLVGEFEKELASLGVDVDALKKDVADLDARLKKLESAKPAVLISGDVNLLILAGHSSSNRVGITQTGIPVGLGDAGTAYAGQPVGITRDLTVLHEAGLTLKGTNEEGPKWHATFVVGNLMNSLGGLRGRSSETGAAPQGGFTEAGNDDIFINELVVSFDSALFGKGFSAQLGRVGHKAPISNVFQRADRTPYYTADRYDNGKFFFDGGIVSFDLGGSNINLFGGKPTPTSVNGNQLNGYNVQVGKPGPAVPVNTILGMDTTVKLGPADLVLAYVVGDSDNVIGVAPKQANQIETYGAEVKFDFSGLKFNGGVSRNDINYNQNDRKTKDVNFYRAGVGYEAEKWGISAEYRNVEAYYVAPGSWGRLGTVWSPNGITGFMGKAWFKPSDNLKVYATGQFYEGDPASDGKVGNALLTKNDDIQSLVFGADYKVNDAFSVYATYEDVQWKLAAAADPYQRWYTIGTNWAMSANANFRFFYQYSDADAKGTGAFAALGLGANRLTGGLIGTQFSLKF
jgi:uncharacterized protein (UPF0335 family)